MNDLYIPLTVLTRRQQTFGWGYGRPGVQKMSFNEKGRSIQRYLKDTLCHSMKNGGIIADQIPAPTKLQEASRVIILYRRE